MEMIRNKRINLGNNKNTKIILVLFLLFFFFIIVHRITMSFLDDTNLQIKEKDNYQ